MNKDFFFFFSEILLVYWKGPYPYTAKIDIHIVYDHTKHHGKYGKI